MELLPLHKLFEIKYGNSFDLNILEECDEYSSDKVNYVSRTRENNGVSAFVHFKGDVEPFESGLISVAGSGNSVLESFIQNSPFYTGYHVFILRPLKAMSELEKLFYCYCIRQNQYKYNFGRQANKTLKDILVPKQMPKEFSKIDSKALNTLKARTVINKDYNLETKNWHTVKLTDLFEVSASSDELITKYSSGGTTPYITSSEFKNGISDFVDEGPTNNANTITANRGGSVGFFFYQPIAYLATPVDVRILTPKFEMNKYIGLFLTTILKKEKYKFNYSRKMGTDRLQKMQIKLPFKKNKPDWEFMETYIKSMPYSTSI